jgi:hypothetical protein
MLSLALSYFLALVRVGIFYQQILLDLFCILLRHAFWWSFSSGDTDAVVPVTATRYSIDALKLPTITNWHPWYDNVKVSAPKRETWMPISSNFFFFNFCYKIYSSSPHKLSCFCEIGWWVEPSIQRTDICNGNWSRTWGSTSSPSPSFHSFQIIFGEQAHAKLNPFNSIYSLKFIQ